MLILLALASLAFAEPTQAEVVLDDGQVLHGQVERQDDGSIILTLGSGTMLRFPPAAIREVRPWEPAATPTDVAVAAPATPAPPAELPVPGEAPGRRKTAAGWTGDPNRSRYLYAPSGFSLGKGRGYVSQKELVITEAAFGITDWWDLQAGTSVVTLLIPGAAFGLVGTKFSLPIGKDFHVAAGGQALFLETSALALGFVTGTYGNEDRHVSVGVGGLTTIIDGVAGAPTGVVATLSGNYRLSSRVALVSENWFLFGDTFTPTGGPVWVVPSLAVRLMGPTFATDLGLVPILTDSDPPVIPIPWVGFTWNFALPYADK